MGGEVRRKGVSKGEGNVYHPFLTNINQKCKEYSESKKCLNIFHLKKYVFFKNLSFLSEKILLLFLPTIGDENIIKSPTVIVTDN